MGYFYTVLGRIAEGFPAVIGMHKTFALGGIFFLAVPVCFAFGGYGMGILGKMGFPLVYAMPMVFVLLFLLGGLYALAYMKLTNESFAVLCLTSIIAFEALLKSWDTITGGVRGFSGVARPEGFSTLSSLAIFVVITAIVLLSFEYILLRTPFGRAIRGMRESKTLLTALGESPKAIGVTLVIMATMLAGISGILYAWRVQFLDPSMSSTANIMVLLTIALLAYRPKVLWLALSNIFVIGVTESMRFLPLPSTQVGYVRLMIYSIVIIVLIFVLADRISPSHRTI